MRKPIRISIVGAVAATVAIATCTPASAVDEYSVTSVHGGARSVFKTYGDILYVTDQIANGRSAIGVIDNGTKYYYWNRTGQGTTRKIDLDLPENRAIALGTVEGDWEGTATGGIIWATLKTDTIMTS